MGDQPILLTRRLAVTMALLGTLLTACTDRGGEDLPGRRLDLPDGFVSSPAWLPDGIVVDWSPKLIDPAEVWLVPDGRPRQRIELPSLPECQVRTEYLHPRALPDGRLLLERHCNTDDGNTSRVELVAYRPGAGDLELLAPLGKYSLSAVSWTRDLQRGYVSYSSGTCAGIAPLTRDGPARFPAPVTLDGHTWRLEEPFFQPGNVGCKELGRASQALLTPDEQRLAFLASPDTQGLEGFSRENPPWHLFVQELPDGQPRRVATGFSAQRGMAMSPDGKRVAIAAKRGDAQGVWLVDLSSGALRELAGAKFSDPAFSPDGTRLAVIFEHDENRGEVRILDV
jgi:WD40-like Beta Propeller Repeat